MKPNSPKSSKMSLEVHQLQQLLTRIITRPNLFIDDNELRTALKSQSSLSRLTRTIESDTGDIITTHSMSLNTLKTRANRYLLGGFIELDNLRKKAAAAIDHHTQHHSSINKRSKSGLTRKVTKLEFEIEAHRETITMLIRAISEAMTSLNIIRDTEDRALREKRAYDAQQSLRAIASMSIPPFNIAAHTSYNLATPSVVVADISSYRQKHER